MLSFCGAILSLAFPGMISSFYLTNAILLIPWGLICFFFINLTYCLLLSIVILLARFDFIRFVLDYNFHRASQKIAWKGMVLYILALNLLLKLTARRSC